MPRIGFTDIVGVGGIVLAVILLVLDKAEKLKGGWLYGLLGLACAMTMFIAIGNSWVLDSGKWVLWRGMLMVCLVVLIYTGIATWIYEPASVVVYSEPSSPTPTSSVAAPSELLQSGAQVQVEWTQADENERKQLLSDTYKLESQNGRTSEQEKELTDKNARLSNLNDLFNRWKEQQKKP